MAICFVTMEKETEKKTKISQLKLPFDSVQTNICMYVRASTL